MTFDDFGLNPKCNVFEEVPDDEFTNGNCVDYALEHIPNESAVFIIGKDDGTVITIVNRKDNPDDCEHKRLSDMFVNADYEGLEASAKMIGAWIMEFMQENDFYKYGIIILNPNQSYEVVNH